MSPARCCATGGIAAFVARRNPGRGLRRRARHRQNHPAASRGGQLDSRRRHPPSSARPSSPAGWPTRSVGAFLVPLRQHLQ